MPKKNEYWTLNDGSRYHGRSGRVLWFCPISQIVTILLILPGNQMAMVYPKLWNVERTKT